MCNDRINKRRVVADTILQDDCVERMKIFTSSYATSFAKLLRYITIIITSTRKDKISSIKYLVLKCSLFYAYVYANKANVLLI